MLGPTMLRDVDQQCSVRLHRPYGFLKFFITQQPKEENIQKESRAQISTEYQRQRNIY